jgi:hypothetical protein
VFLNGWKDKNRRSTDRGVIDIRGSKAAEEIKATMEQLEACSERS